MGVLINIKFSRQNLCRALAALTILIGLFYIKSFELVNNKNAFALPEKNVPHQNKHENRTNNGYDSKITGLDKYRLGFSTELLPLPKSWEDKLFELKPKYHENLKGDDNTSLSSLINKSNHVGEKKLLRLKTILVYLHDPWLKINPKDSAGNKNPEFQCKFIDWNITKADNVSIAENSLVASARNADAILISNTRTIDKKIMKAIYTYTGKVSDENKNLNAPKPNSIILGPKLVSFSLEPPAIPWHSFKLQNMRNNSNRARDLLATFWRGSDIYSPYARWKYFNNEESSLLPGENKNYAEGRTKMAAIVVSRCNAKNNRLKLVHKLQEFIEVDIYGKCGTFECPKADCFEQIKKNYKFYLAFENSNCRDYITEKLFKNSYSNDLLPVVLGAHPLDYKAVAPPHSYIHVEDFESVENLGRYLLHLHQNDTLYNSYFMWKGTGAFYGDHVGVLRETCAYLHAQDLTVEEYASEELDVTLGKNEASGETVLPYFNQKDKYNFDTFDFSTKDGKLGLKDNEWYWNK